MLLKEFRIVLPMTVEEYQVAQLYSVAEASKNETGGGEGIEVLKNEPFDADNAPPDSPMKSAYGTYTTGQFTHKIYHLQSKVPGWIRFLAPKGSLEIHEKAWNAYPYCRTVINNPDYMKENFYIIIESMHYEDRGETENIHDLDNEDLKKRQVVNIDIAHDPVRRGDYKEEWDPTKFKSTKTDRGALTGPDWKTSVRPVMCSYKLVRCYFKWFGLQNRVEKFIMTQEQRLFFNFHRQVFCWTDKWYGLTMEDIRKIEEETKKQLDEARLQGGVKGTTASDDD
ncbi:phosphatidylinositol transfer protein alpha isoform-like [Gigantopelta aegis]|uniref:phosphatidylinositol transfer protein alpha isoform-like n=1 Tax=Gigantopelta aegis TaxID=1735272 RepID=UPI001B8884C2|nr:phosphatidylinositol transfer protein alpha isoform-like [Gigantopelta aegis]